MSESDFPDLVRFVEAQDSGATAADPRVAGPQVAGLGQSPTAVHYGVRGLDEARAYLAHPVLGPRLVDCADVLAGLEATDAVEVLGGIDAVKLRSSMTLFAHAADDERTRRRFTAVLDHYFGGEEDPATLARI